MPAKCKMQILDADPLYSYFSRRKRPRCCRQSRPTQRKSQLSLCVGTRLEQHLDPKKADMPNRHLFKQQRQQPHLCLQPLNFDHLRLRAPGDIGER